MILSSQPKKMSLKRENPYFPSAAGHKRRRPLPPYPAADTLAGKSPATVIVTGICPECSVLELKSRFQIYGCISRTTMQPTGVAYVTFRSKDSAESAVAAAMDPSFGITIDSRPVQVMWATDPVPVWYEGVSQKDTSPYSLSSKLVRPEVPLSRHGRSKRLGSSIVNPRSKNADSVPTAVAIKGREIVAYDDIL